MSSLVRCDQAVDTGTADLRGPGRRTRRMTKAAGPEVDSAACALRSARPEELLGGSRTRWWRHASREVARRARRRCRRRRTHHAPESERRWVPSGAVRCAYHALHTYRRSSRSSLHPPPLRSGVAIRPCLYQDVKHPRTTSGHSTTDYRNQFGNDLDERSRRLRGREWARRTGLRPTVTERARRRSPAGRTRTGRSWPARSRAPEPARRSSPAGPRRCRRGSHRPAP